MSKMNRRDYLKGMGATAGAIAGGTTLDVFAQDRRTSPGRRQPKGRRPVKLALRPPLLRWPITRTLPSPNAFVTVIFGGLMGFCPTEHDHLPACEVGFHKGGGHHKLDFKIYKKVQGGCSLVKELPTNKDMILRLTPETNRGPDFYQSRPAFFDRINGDPHDFRWLPDLHSGDFYPEGYGLNGGYYKNSIYVHDGTFYTRVRTNSTFKLVNVTDDNDNLEIRGFGHVAMYMAAGIAAQAGDTVVLSIDGQNPETFPWASGVTYQIVLTNECYEAGSHCNFRPDDPLEENRNDFHFNREVLKVPSGRTKFGLMIDESGGTEPASDFCHPMRISDEAPCMGSGYGRGPGFP